MENIKHKFSFSDQKSREGDWCSCQLWTCEASKTAYLHFLQIKGESRILCALYFYLLSTPTQLFWIQNRYVLQEFSFASLQIHVVEGWRVSMWDKTVGMRRGCARCSGQGAGKMVRSRPPSLPPTWAEEKFSPKVRKWVMGQLAYQQVIKLPIPPYNYTDLPGPKLVNIYQVRGPKRSVFFWKVNLIHHKWQD